MPEWVSYTENNEEARVLPESNYEVSLVSNAWEGISSQTYMVSPCYSHIPDKKQPLKMFSVKDNLCVVSELMQALNIFQKLKFVN